MRKNKLTFAIITYNRKRELELNLKNLIPIAQKYPIEILISDNASTDETQLFCEELVKKYEFITYNKQKYNLGYDGNIISAITKSNAPYVWLNGDTRTIEEKYFPFLMEIINSEIYDSISFHDNINFDRKPFITSNLSDLLSTEGFRYSLVGTFIIRNPYIEESVYQKYANLRFMHIPFLFETLYRLPHSTNIILSNRYFKSIEKKRQSQKFWNRNYFEVFSKCWFYTIMSLPNSLSVDSKIQCLKGLKTNHIFSLKNIIRKYAMGVVSKDDYLIGRPYLEFTSPTPAWKFDILFLIPQSLFKFTYFFIKKIKNKI